MADAVHIAAIFGIWGWHVAAWLISAICTCLLWLWYAIVYAVVLAGITVWMLITHPKAGLLVGAYLIYSSLTGGFMGGFAVNIAERSRNGRSGRSEEQPAGGTMRKGGDGFDLDFDDYKLVDPDYALHGFRSGDKIDDQRSHERWEHCNS